MTIIGLLRRLSLISIDAIWPLCFVCLSMSVIASFLRYTGYLKFINDPISRVLLLIFVHVLLPNGLNFDFMPHCDLKPCYKILYKNL